MKRASALILIMSLILSAATFRYRNRVPANLETFCHETEASQISGQTSSKPPGTTEETNPPTTRGSPSATEETTERTTEVVQTTSRTTAITQQTERVTTTKKKEAGETCSMIDKRIYPQRAQIDSRYQSVADRFLKLTESRQTGTIQYQFNSFDELDCFNKLFKAAYGFYPIYDAGLVNEYGNEVKITQIYGNYMYEEYEKANKVYEDADRAFNYIDEAIASIGINSETTVTDAVKKINNYICARFDYGVHCDDDYLFYDTGNQNNLNRYTAICHGFASGKMICCGYAEVFKEMCLAVGIDVRIVVGSSPEGGHAWNRVVFKNGTSKYVDVCWNDTTGTKQWLLVSYDKISEEHYNGRE